MLRLLIYFSLALLTTGKTIEITQKKSGKTLEVKILKIKDGDVTFALGKKEFTVPINSLVEESAQEINALSFGLEEEEPEEVRKNEVDNGFFEEEEESESPKKAPSGQPSEESLRINEAIGHDLFGDNASLWDETAEDIASRLKWERESKKKNNSSYRLYTPLDYTFLGAHPYCVTLYGGAKDVPERFSLVFANKGDFGSRLGIGEDHFRIIYPDKDLPADLDTAITLDQAVLSASLTAALGEPEKQYYGEKEDMRRVQRWDTGEHAFLLSAKAGEYVHLLIVRTSDADVKGKVQFVKDSDLKKIQSKNVVKEDNGDVWIDNIPMVDQGPKGYCAPATFERAMRYMQVPADMYLLATAATTQKGTNTVKLADDAKRIVRSKARRIKELSLEKDFNLKTIQKYVDKGVPVLWQMYSLSLYNKIANDRSKERNDVEDMEKWAIEIQEEANESAELLSLEDNAHICMVVGYNPDTNEVAVSDSWGARYELRWVHLDVCKAVTSRGGFVIDF